MVKESSVASSNPFTFVYLTNNSLAACCEVLPVLTCLVYKLTNVVHCVFPIHMSTIYASSAVQRVGSTHVNSIIFVKMFI